MFDANADFWCKDNSHKDFTGTNLIDNIGHSEAVVKAILLNMNVKRFCITMFKWWDGMYSAAHVKSYSNSLKNLDKIRFVTIAASGSGYISEEYNALKSLINKNVTIVVAAGNDHKNLDKSCDVYPACYNLDMVVASDNVKSNYGSVVDKYVSVIINNQTGSSLSAGYVTGQLAK